MDIKNFHKEAVERLSAQPSLDVLIDQLNEYAADPSQSFMLNGLAKTEGLAQALYETGRIDELNQYARMAIDHYYEEQADEEQSQHQSHYW